MFHSSLGSVFLWSNKKVEFPSLQLFTDESLQNILSELSNPQVVFFQGKIQQTQTGFLKELKDMYSAYIPSSMLNLENETRKDIITIWKTFFNINFEQEFVICFNIIIDYSDFRLSGLI